MKELQKRAGCTGPIKERVGRIGPKMEMGDCTRLIAPLSATTVISHQPYKGKGRLYWSYKGKGGLHQPYKGKGRLSPSYKGKEMSYLPCKEKGRSFQSYKGKGLSYRSYKRKLTCRFSAWTPLPLSKEQVWCRELYVNFLLSWWHHFPGPNRRGISWTRGGMGWRILHWM